jgi:SOS-response transcriptional repressor LexA
LILQLCRQAVGESRTDNIEPESVSGAAQLVRYFLSHAERIYPRLHTTAQDKQVEAAVSWIKTHGSTTTAREVQMMRVAGVKSASEAKVLLGRLEDRGFGMVTTTGNRVSFTLH